MQKSDLRASSVRGLPKDQVRRVLASLSDEDALELLYDWEFWARPEQLAPVGDWFVWLIRSGRGFGKTRTGAEWVISRARAGFTRIALVGQTKADVRDTMIELGDSSILKVSPPWFRPVYEPSKRRLVWPNGAIAIAYSGDEPDQLRGPQHDSAWVDELAKFKYAGETWSNLLFGLRIGKRPQVCVTTTPRPIPLMRELLASKHTVDVQRPTWDNLDNLAEAFRRNVIEKYQGTRLGRQELEGAMLDDTPGALWQRATVERCRVIHAPLMQRIVVAVDPAASSTPGANETGIVVVGVANRQGYVLDDMSIEGSPLQWANQAAAAYDKWKADRVVYEANNGGEMVAQTLHTANAKLPLKKVWASRGKQTRAEPVASLYEQTKVHHVGAFPLMEDQMCTWVPGEDSPDRLDALVWAVTDLLLDGGGQGAYQY